MFGHQSCGFVLPAYAHVLPALSRRRWMRRIAFDVLPAAEYIKNLAGPVLLVEHNVEHLRLRTLARMEASLLKRAVLRVQSALLKRYEASVLRRVRNIVAVSSGDLYGLCALFPSVRGAVVPNGAEVYAATPAAAANPVPTALWVGGMDDPYNKRAVDYFLGAVFPSVLARIPDFVWLVVGREPTAALIQAAALYPGNIRILGFVKDLQAVYAAADVVVPTLVAGGGTKLKVLEAMAHGKAIVTTSVGSEGLAIDNGVNAIVEDEPMQIAGKVCQLLKDPRLRESLGVAARATVREKYGWESVVRTMHATIEEVSLENGGEVRAGV